MQGNHDRVLGGKSDSDSDDGDNHLNDKLRDVRLRMYITHPSNKSLNVIENSNSLH